MAKHKKRNHSRTVDLKRQMEQEKLADEKERAKKRMNPTARALLLIDLVFLAVVAILDPGGRGEGLISREAGGICTVIGVILLIAALWIQFGPQDKNGGPRQGPRL